MNLTESSTAASQHRYNDSSYIDGNAARTASQVINTLLLVATVWLATSFIAYGRHSGKWQRKKKHDYKGGAVLAIAVLATVAVLPRIVLTQVIILVGNESTPRADLACEVALDMSIVMFFLALLPTYTYLWMRQRALYAQPSINRLYTKPVQVLTWASYAVLVMSGIGIVVLFVTPNAYRGSARGCVLREEEEDNVVPFYIMVATQVIGQLVLVGLFIYPLKLHRKVQIGMLDVRKKSNAATESAETKRDESASDLCESTLDMYQATGLAPASSAVSDDGSNGSISKSDLSLHRSKSETCINAKTRYLPIRRSMGAVSRKLSNGVQNRFNSRRRSSNSAKNCNRVLRVMRRSVVCTTVCILSDLTAMAAVAFLLPKDTPKSLTNAVYDVSLLANLFSVVMSFECYDKILLFFCGRQMAQAPVMVITPVSQSQDGLSVS